LNGDTPLPDTAITANFAEDGTVGGSDGCNVYNATYQVDGNNITITPGISTLMACVEPVMNQATEYLTALESAATYQIQGDTMELRDSGDNAVASFAAQPTSLAGTSWDVIGYNNGREAVVSVIIGTELTAMFGADGSLTGSAGCNNYTGSYESDGDGSISVGPLATTRMMCSDPEGIMEQEQEYLAALQSAATYRMDGTTMEMRTAEGSLAVTFQMTQQ
jgi:heat shock protein HslJ